MRGFTIIELLIVTAIIILLAGIVLVGFRNYQFNRALELATKEVRQTLEEARSRTLASVNDLSYGVFIESDRVTLFSGEDFDPSDPSNQVLIFDHRVSISDISFDPDTSTILFTRGTGESNAEGYLEISLVNRSEKKKRINVSKQGIINSNE